MLRDYELDYIQDLKDAKDLRHMVSQLYTEIWTLHAYLSDEVVHSLEYCLKVLEAYREVDNG